MRYYGTPWEREADFPFNFDLVNVAADGVVDKVEIEDAVNQWMFNMPSGRVANWLVGDHDNVRLASRIPDLDSNGIKSVSKQFAQLTMTLPGTNFIYNGEELGMKGLTETELPKECQIDIQEDTRDVARNPMQWNGNTTENYGFSDCNPSENNQGMIKIIIFKFLRCTYTKNLTVFTLIITYKYDLNLNISSE